MNFERIRIGPHFSFNDFDFHASDEQTNLALYLWEAVLFDCHIRRHGSAGKIHTLARCSLFEAFWQHKSEQSGGYAGTEGAIQPRQTKSASRVYFWIEETWAEQH